MLYHKCGGKLIVYDTLQVVTNGKTCIKRMRRCNICGEIVASSEFVADAYIKPDYHHSCYTGDGLKKEDNNGKHS